MSEKKPLLDMSNRVVLITGAGQGVGEGIAKLMAQQNASVVVNDFFEDRAEKVAKAIRDTGGKAIGVAGDVSDMASVKAMVERAEKEFGPVDVLVNNAGNAGPTGFPQKLPFFWESEPEEWGKYFSVNLYGVLNCCHAMVGKMTERGFGRIITIVSDAGREGEPKLAVYSGAKAGAAGFMRALAKETGRFGVTANCIALSSINNPQLAEQFKHIDPAIIQKNLKGYSIRRFGEPEDIAPLVLLLSSEESSWITGQTYPVNGGYSTTK